MAIRTSARDASHDRYKGNLKLSKALAISPGSHVASGHKPFGPTPALQQSAIGLSPPPVFVLAVRLENQAVSAWESCMRQQPLTVTVNSQWHK